MDDEGVGISQLDTASKKKEIKRGNAIIRSFEMKEDMSEQMRLRRDASSLRRKKIKSVNSNEPPLLVVNEIRNEAYFTSI